MTYLGIDERFTAYEINRSGYSSGMIAKELGREKVQLIFRTQRNISAKIATDLISQYICFISTQ